tara:strand:+ start:299 stop:679 length:381 start_codon:yes stop_codon:yes gene_type:complete
MVNNYHSKTSKYYYIYKQFNSKSNNLSSNYIYKEERQLLKDKQKEEQKFLYIEQQLNKLNWFDAQVFKLYYLDENFTSILGMSHATKISRYSLQKSLNKVRAHFKHKTNIVWCKWDNYYKVWNLSI